MIEFIWNDIIGDICSSVFTTLFLGGGGYNNNHMKLRQVLPLPYVIISINYNL